MATIRRAIVLPGFLFLASVATATAQVPAGGEFRVNSTTTFAQKEPTAAMAANGDFVIAWSHRAGAQPQYAIGGQRFDAAGARLGGEFIVNTYTTGVQGVPDIAADGRGRFVVVWTGQEELFGQRYDQLGAPLGQEFQVSSTPPNYGPNRDSAMAVDESGRFVVTWSSNYGGPADPELFARRFDSAAAPQGGQFVVNSATAVNNHNGGIGVDAAGNFVVVWTAFRLDLFTRDMLGRRYDSSGTPTTAAFVIGSPTTLVARYPVVAMEPGGDFTVVWSDYQAGPSSFVDVFAQRFTAAGTPRGAQFLVNTYTTGHQSVVVAAGFAGGFVAAWISTGQDGGSDGVFAQRFASDGTRRGAEFRVNTYTTHYQRVGGLAADPVGNFIVSWSSFNQDGSSYGVYAQRYGGLVPVAIGVDTTGNGVWEPGETVDVRPSWLNVTSAAQTFAGSMISVSGPAGATYAVTDPTGNYGLVANGASAQCSDCYAVSVSNPPTRPVVHWDATAVESITPDAQGQQKQWTLHVGGSFADVPAASPYYRFAETLLHRRVTAGCTATQYCPSASTSREQMAVFVLVAKEGSGYAPPACTTPMFADVPASSPFCRWIEELARRGVVAGCGGGNYCPTAPVSREEMAVFVLATKEPGFLPPACGAPPMFSDVPASSPFCRWIEELARRGVVTGCGGGAYCPTAPVTREQMGVFLSVTFGLLLYGP